MSCDIFLSNSETLEAERALIEERYEDKINNLQKHLKKFYSQELKVRFSSMCFQGLESTVWKYSWHLNHFTKTFILWYLKIIPAKVWQIFIHILIY